MTTIEGRPAPEAVEDVADQERPITAHRSAPDRTVFVEEDNKDGWIATDYTVDLTR
jgi:hypothetical protein